MASDTFEEEEPQEVGMVHFESGDDEKKGISSSRVVWSAIINRCQ